MLFRSRSFYLDPTHTYRVSVQVHITGPTMVDLGGYASDGKNPTLKTDNGKIWQYRLSKKGPTQDWVTLQVTMGPPGSGADCIFPEGILCTTMHFSPTADGPGSVYLDNFSFQDMTLEK